MGKEFEQSQASAAPDRSLDASIDTSEDTTRQVGTSGELREARSSIYGAALKGAQSALDICFGDASSLLKACAWAEQSGSKGDSNAAKVAKNTDQSDLNKQIDQWMQDLGSDDFDTRNKASQSLSKHLGEAMPRIVKALDSGDLEVKRRCKELVAEGLKADKDDIFDKTWNELSRAARTNGDGSTSKVMRDDYFASRFGQSPDELTESKELTPSGDQKITDRDLSILKEFPQVHVLDLRFRSNISNDGLAHLSGMKNLKDLKLDLSNDATGQGLQHLSNLRQLESLSLEGVKLSTNGLSALKDLTNLKTLDVSFERGAEKENKQDVLKELSNMSKLEMLQLHGIKIPTSALGHIKDLTNLRSLRVDTDSALKDADLENLSKLTKLEYLPTTSPHMEFSDKTAFSPVLSSEVTDKGLAHISKLTELKYLDLDNTQVTSKGLAYIRGLNKLETLHLSGLKIGDKDLANLQDMKELSILGLDNTQVTDKGLSHLKGLTSLWGLHLADTKVTGTGLDALKDLRNLRLLVLNNSPVNDSGAAKIGDLKKVDRLYLDRTRITDEGLSKLKELNLQFLSLADTKISDSGLANLEGMKKLMYLNLGKCKVTDAGLEQVKNCSNLRSLLLDYTQVTDAGLAHLPDLKKLNALDLRGTKITNSGLTDLSKLDLLRGLDVSDNRNISDQGFAQLEHLERLNVSNTKVSDLAGLKMALPKCRISPDVRIGRKEVWVLD